MRNHFFSSSVKCVGAFRIALTYEPRLLIKQKHSWNSHLSILSISLRHWRLLILRLRKSTDKGLKNHYIISKKTSITNGKNTYKKQVCNQQEIN